jgi:cellulose synthase/poly-beta-1,6-N-acetylglucosamine synthase-like glycosyltransferase
MSALAYSGAGLVVLTAAALAKKGLEVLARKWQPKRLLPPTRGTQLPTAPPVTAMLAAPVTVAVVVPAHNEAATIAATVHSCLHQTYPVEQVIVVADSCTDATATLSRRSGATVIEGEGGSKAAAQNLALPYVIADLVVAIDGDNTLEATAVAQMVTTMRAGHAGTCASVLPKDTTTIYSQYRTLYHAVANGWIKQMQDTLGRQLVLNGMANCHRMDVLTELGGFPDGSMTEDFDLTWALHRRGYSVAFTPKAFVYTQEPTSFPELIGQMHRWTSGFAQCMVEHKAPLVDAASFIVVVTLVLDAFVGGLATLTLLPFLARHGIAGSWRWWHRLWILVSAANIGVCINQLGVRTTLRCLPGWFILQTATGPINAWWLLQEWVLGRHLTTWTGRHGRRAILTPMSPQHKRRLLTAAAVLACAATPAIRRRASPRGF